LAARPNNAAKNNNTEIEQRKGGCLSIFKFSLGKVNIEEPEKLSSKMLES